MPTVYLASPLSFSPEWRSYRERIKERLTRIGCTGMDPWHQSFGSILKKAKAVSHWHERVKALKEAAGKIGQMNATGIRDSDVLLGVLDGAELDSGTVCEIGFAAGLGKRCYGLRTDFRDLGDFEGLPIYLQVLYTIESSGRRLFRRIRDIEF